MSIRIPVAMVCLFGIAACGEPPSTEEETASFNIDRTRITVSGVSSGAYMAGQYHLAHSSEVSGAGLIAGGPYWCAAGSMNRGLGPCMNGEGLEISGSVDYANAEARAGTIDALQNLGGDRVWVFHGANDSIINPAVSSAAVDFYSQFTEEGHVTTVTDIEAPHGMPTVASDGACDEVATPFLNNCGYDAAGELLHSITSIANTRADAAVGELLTIPQAGGADAEMLDGALLFVPVECAEGALCGLHIAFHGCQQSTEFVGNAFAENAGFNEWAENNRLLVLYPQVASSKFAPLNPLGCWDWWGYTNENYATRNGAQISVVKSLVDTLSRTAN